MRIACIGKVTEEDNQDELAVCHALSQLGHEVIPVHEQRRKRGIDIASLNVNFGLFFKWEDYGEIKRVSQSFPLCYWHFDLISSQEESLKARMETRRNWCETVLPFVKLGVHTDGTWVRQNPNRPYLHLMQGADERQVGQGTPSKGHKPILFTGMISHGQKRVEHVRHLQERWGNKFEVLGDAGPRHRLHGKALADRIASSRIVIAPDNPVSDQYWSNRVYLSLGFGAFLLHPYCEGLKEHYSSEELVMYSSWNELDDLIEYYLKDEHESERQRLMQAGYKRTLRSNLYRHRCEELVKVMQERI